MESPWRKASLNLSINTASINAEHDEEEEKALPALSLKELEKLSSKYDYSVRNQKIEPKV